MATSKPWTKSEIRTLRSCARQKLSTAQTAKKLKRTPGAVSQKARMEGIKFRRASVTGTKSKTHGKTRKTTSRRRSTPQTPAKIAA